MTAVGGRLDTDPMAPLLFKWAFAGLSASVRYLLRCLDGDDSGQAAAGLEGG